MWFQPPGSTAVSSSDIDSLDDEPYQMVTCNGQVGLVRDTGLGDTDRIGQERIMRVSAVRRQERDTPTHLIKNCNSTHDGRVSKDRLVMADGTRTYSSVLDGTSLLEGKKQLSTNLGRSCLSASLSRYC